jgi:hypothetical protein
MESGMQKPSQSNVPVYIKKSEFRAACGDPIYIPVDDGRNIPGNHTFRKATIGGYLRLKARDGMITTVGITVAHAFEPPHQDTNGPQSIEYSDDEDSNFEFDGPSPDYFPNQYDILSEIMNSCM